MTFIVILIALLIERFFDWSHLRHWSWLSGWQHHLMQRVPAFSAYSILAITIVPLLLATALLQFMFAGAFYGFAELLFQLVVLLYCFGPKNLWADTFACINAMTQGDCKFASEKLRASFGNTTAPIHRHFLNDIFIEANRRVFATVFWFFVLGPVGAVLYRAIAVSLVPAPKNENETELTQSAHAVEGVLDWMPVRVLSMIFAIGGHCAKVLSCWGKKAAFGFSSNEMLLTECGVAALGIEDPSSIPADGVTEKSAVSLLDRTFVITLMIVAFLVIFG